MARPQKLYIVGNWKMNPDTLLNAKSVFSASERTAKKARKVTVIIAPPIPYLTVLSRGAKKKTFLSAQDVHSAPDGAHTGGVSARQAREVGASYTIVGHSERRKEGDTDEIIAQKTLTALDAGLKVILCVGELLRDEHGAYLQEVSREISVVFSTIPKKYISDIIVAYEPSWAIGKGYDSALSPQGIHEMIIFIKKVIAEIVGRDEAMRIPVLYGGSVDFNNAQAILSDGEVSGLLIGRQSLDIDAFSNIILYANGL
jgi:triosephosphate isomerase